MDRQTQKAIARKFLHRENVARISAKANARAQRRFSVMVSTGSYSDSTAEPTVLYSEAERLIDRLAA